MSKHQSKSSAAATIDTGKLQQQLADSRRAETLAEKALLRAQDSRDAARAKREVAEQSFRDATRAVLG